MAKNFLNRAQVRASLQQIGSHSMTQSMWRNRDRDASQQGIFFYQPLDAAGGEWNFVEHFYFLVVTGKQGGGIVTTALEVGFEGMSCRRREEHDADFIALAFDREFIFFKVDLAAFEICGFRDPQASGE